MSTDSQRYSVVARFSAVKAGAVVTAGLVMVAALYILPFYSSAGNPVGYMLAHGRWAGFIVLAWLASIYFLRLLFAVAGQLLFRGSAAVWIDDGYVVYLSKSRNGTKLHEIATLSIDRLKSYGIPKILLTITRRDGTTRVIPTGLLSEPAGVVLRRLQGFIDA